MKRRKRRKPLPYVPPFVACGLGCVSGWIETPRGAVRCSCVRAWQAKYATEKAS